MRAQDGRRRRAGAAILLVAAGLVAWRTCASVERPAPGTPSAPTPAQTDRAARRPGRPATPPEMPESAAPPPPAAEAPSAVAGVEVVVIDAEGRPAPGAEASFTNASGFSTTGPAATTDAEGRARVGPPRETCGVRLRATRGDDVALGDVHDAPFIGGVLRLAPGVAIHGLVADAAGRPISGVWVRACPSSLEAVALICDATTGADGTFRLAVLPAAALADGVELHATYDFSAALLRVDAEGARKPVSIVLAAESKRRIRGRCVDEDGAPVAKVRVSVLGDRDWREKDWTETEENGRFEVRSAGDLVSLGVVPPAHAALVLTAHAAAEGAADLGDVVLHAGGTISGRVIDETGAPRPSAYVDLVGDAVGVVRSASADEDGNFVLEAVGDGPFAVVTEETFGTDEPSRHGRVDGVHAGDAHVRLVAAPGRSARLRLIAAETGRPLEATVWFVRAWRGDADRKEAFQSEHHGGRQTTIDVLLPTPGRYDVAFAVPGRRCAVLRGIDVKDDEVAAVDVVLWLP